MRSGFDKLYVWMTLDGKRVVDLDPQDFEELQELVYIKLMTKNNIIPKDTPCQKELLLNQLLEESDGTGWIDQAKEMGIIRKRTKQERIVQDFELDASLT